MITTGFGFAASVFALLALYYVFTEKFGNAKVFKVVPTLIVFYVLFILCSHFGLWSYDETSQVNATKQAMTDTEFRSLSSRL